MATDGEISLDYKSAKQVPWVKLSALQDEKLFAGFLLRFKQKHGGPSGYSYAYAVRYNGSEQISFMDFEGQSWGGGASRPLPEESYFQSQPCTVDVNWLKRHFSFYFSVRDENDVWFCHSFLPIPVDLET